MTPYYSRLIHSWNTDVLWSTTLRGRVLVAQEREGGLVVSWRDGEKLRVYPITATTILNEGWDDALTDLIDLLGKPELASTSQGAPKL